MNSEHHLPTGDVNRLPGAVRGFRAGVKQQHVQHVLIIAPALQRHFVDVVLFDVLRFDAKFGGILRQQGLEHRGFQQVTQHQRVHGNAVFGQIQRQRLRQPDAAKLRRAVAGVVLAAHFPRF